jgi:polar amino acid transport system substrate-binding protein
MRRLVVLLLLACWQVASATGTTGAPMAAGETWRIVAIDLPPAIGPNAAQQGYYAVLLRRVLSELNARPTFIFLPPQRAYQVALAGNADAALPFRPTPEREQHLWFTEPFFVATIRVFVRSDGGWLPGSVAALRGERGCTLQGAQSPVALQQEVDSGRVSFERVSVLDACFRLLQAGRVGFVVAGHNSGWLAARALADGGSSIRMAPFVVAEEPIRLALPKIVPASRERLERFNAAVKRLRTELKQLEASVVPARPKD